MREATVSLSAHAVRHGRAAVLPAEFDSPVSGRGERSQPDTLRVKVLSGHAMVEGCRVLNAR